MVGPIRYRSQKLAPKFHPYLRLERPKNEETCDVGRHSVKSDTEDIEMTDSSAVPESQGIVVIHTITTVIVLEQKPLWRPHISDFNAALGTYLHTHISMTEAADENGFKRLTVLCYLTKVLYSPMTVQSGYMITYKFSKIYRVCATSGALAHWHKPFPKTVAIIRTAKTVHEHPLECWLGILCKQIQEAARSGSLDFKDVSWDEPEGTKEAGSILGRLESLKGHSWAVDSISSDDSLMFIPNIEEVEIHLVGYQYVFHKVSPLPNSVIDRTDGAKAAVIRSPESNAQRKCNTLNTNSTVKMRNDLERTLYNRDSGDRHSSYYSCPQFGDSRTKSKFQTEFTIIRAKVVHEWRLGCWLGTLFKQSKGTAKKW
ncbi:hypothetical protein F5879DRAFT_1056821 [Lentinula edodes]|nr:hypothetical protein F5879DRAFT_1056821 [Lentinula edodes]